jgi:hypothetical protein
MVWQGFVVGSRFEGCFHNFYERWVLHNIEGDVRLIKESCTLLVQILIFGWIQSLGQWNLLKGLNVVICGFVRTLYVICRGVKFRAPSTWNIETYSPSTERFGVSMATSSVHPSRIWFGTSMSFSGEGQIHHIGQIVLSPVNVPLNTLQL